MSFMVKSVLAFVSIWVVFSAGSVTPVVRTNPVLVQPGFEVRNASKVVAITAVDNYGHGGTGFEVRAASGAVYTLTNHHICELAGDDGILMAHTESGRAIPLRVIDDSKTEDLCLMEGIVGSSAFDLAKQAYITEYVVVYGHPYLRPLEESAGIITDYGPETTYEEYSGKGCDLFGEKVIEVKEYFGLTKHKICARTLFSAQINALVYPGNSGSPVLDRDEKVVGVAYAADGNTHYGAMVPLISVYQFLEKY